MIIVMGTMRVKPDTMDAVREAMSAMMAATHEERGCVSYNLCEDLMEPGRIRVSEEWSDMAALEAHFETPHMRIWRAALTEAGVDDRDVKIYDATLVKPI